MKRQQISKALLGVGLGFSALALILSALPVAGSAPAAPPAQPSERPTIDVAGTHAAQTEAARPPATDTSAPPGGGGGGVGETPVTPLPGVSPTSTASPTATRPRVTRIPSPTPTQTPDVGATNEALVQAAIQGTLTALPPGATAFITITVLAPTAVPPTLAPAFVPPTTAPVSAPTQPATVAEANQLGAALWLVVVVPLVLLIVVLFWLVGYRFLLPFVGLGRPRPRQGDVKAGRQYARRKRTPY